MKSYDEICKNLREVQTDKVVGKINDYELRRFRLFFDEVYSESFLKKVIFLPKDVRKVSGGHYYSWCTTIEYDYIDDFVVKRHEGQGLNNYHGYGFYLEYVCLANDISKVLNLVSKFVDDWEKDIKCLSFDKEAEKFNISIFVKYTKSPEPDSSDLTPFERVVYAKHEID